MLDKHELQDLLVRLKLGTVSVDGAIEEIEKNFYDENELSFSFLKNTSFEQVTFCEGKSIDYLKRIIDMYLEKRISFICVGIDNDIAVKLGSYFDGIDIFYEAGIAAKTYTPIKSKGFKAAIVSSACDLSKPCHEAESVLNLFGVETEIILGVHPDKFSTVKNRLQNVSAVIVASESTALAEVVSSVFLGPVVSLPLSRGKDVSLNGFCTMLGSVSSPWGVTTVNIDSGFAAAMAIYRVCNK